MFVPFSANAQARASVSRPHLELEKSEQGLHIVFWMKPESCSEETEKEKTEEIPRDICTLSCFPTQKDATAASSMKNGPIWNCWSPPWPLLGDCDDNVDVFWTLRLNSVTVFPVADEVAFTHSYAPSKKKKNFYKFPINESKYFKTLLTDLQLHLFLWSNQRWS